MAIDATDNRVAGAVVALYLVLAAALLPPAEHPRMLGGGLLVFGGVAALARWLGRGPLSPLSVLAVEIVSAIVLLMPTLPAMGGTHPAAVPIGFLGVQAAVLSWAALRWRRPPGAMPRTSLLAAWRHGFLMAVLLCAFATIPVLLAVSAGDAAPAGIVWLYPAYFAGMIGAATSYWLLQRIAHLATGRYLIGVLGGVCVYGAVMPLVAMVEPGGEPLGTGTMLVLALAAGCLVGPAVALGRRRGVTVA